MVQLKTGWNLASSLGTNCSFSDLTSSTQNIKEIYTYKNNNFIKVSKTERLELDKGYWINVDKDIKLLLPISYSDYNPEAEIQLSSLIPIIESTPLEKRYTGSFIDFEINYKIDKGWNLIANPLPNSDTLLKSLIGENNLANITATVYYDNENKKYVQSETHSGQDINIQPGGSIWILSNTDFENTISNPLLEDLELYEFIFRTDNIPQDINDLPIESGYENILYLGFLTEPDVTQERAVKVTVRYALQRPDDGAVEKMDYYSIYRPSVFGLNINKLSDLSILPFSDLSIRPYSNLNLIAMTVLKEKNKQNHNIIIDKFGNIHLGMVPNFFATYPNELARLPRLGIPSPVTNDSWTQFYVNMYYGAFENFTGKISDGAGKPTIISINRSMMKKEYSDVRQREPHQERNLQDYFYSSNYYSSTIDRCFYNCKIENNDYGNDIINWDLSNANSIRSTFGKASKFNKDISNWNTSNIFTMDGVFESACDFNQSINIWDTSNVEYMIGTFYNTCNYNQPLDNWNTSNVIFMDGVFNRASVFNRNINTWDTGNVISMDCIFEDAHSFNQPLNDWNTSKVVVMDELFKNAISFNQDINTWNTCDLFTAKEMFKNAKAFNRPLSNWNVQCLENISGMFRDASVFNNNLNDWNTHNVTNMSLVFANATEFNQPLDGWKTTNVSNMNSMFYNAENFNQPLNNWETTSLESMNYMFANAEKFNYPLNDWNTSNVKTMNALFKNAISFNDNITNWQCDSIVSAVDMFNKADNWIENYKQICDDCQGNFNGPPSDWSQKL